MDERHFLKGDLIEVEHWFRIPGRGLLYPKVNDEIELWKVKDGDLGIVISQEGDRLAVYMQRHNVKVWLYERDLKLTMGKNDEER